MKAPHRKQALLAECWILLLGAFLPTAITYVYFCQFAGKATASQLAVYVVAKGIQFAIPLLWVGALVREPFPWRPAPKRTWSLAILFGLIVGATIGGFYFLMRTRIPEFQTMTLGVQAKVIGLGMSTPGRYLGLALFYSVIHSFLEEYYWRWFFHGRLRTQLSQLPATIISSFMFALHHVVVLGTLMGWQSPYPYVLSACISIGGAVWSYFYESSQSLLPSWISHALVDGAIFAVGAVMISPLWTN